MEDPTPEAAQLARDVLKRFEARPPTTPDDRGLARSLHAFLAAWGKVLGKFEGDSNVSGGPGDAVPERLDPGPVVRGLRAKLRELAG